MEKLRGENPNQILKLVSEVEHKSTILNDLEVSFQKNASRIAYFHDSSWIKIRNKNDKIYYTNILRSSFKSLIRGRFYTLILNLLASYKKISKTDVFATWIYVKNNVIVLYPDFGLACKIRRPKSIRDAESLYNEYTVLKLLKGYPGLLAPEPIAFQKEPTPALWIKYIDELKAINKIQRTEIASQIAETLFGWYEHNGIEIIHANTYEPLLQILTGGITGLKEQGWNTTDATTMLSSLRKVAELNIPLIISQIHGDASTGNAMISNDYKLYITDWESSRRDLVAYDIRKLIRTNSNIEQRYSDWIRSKIDITSINIKKELALSFILSNNDLNKKRYYYSKVTRYNEKNAEARLKVTRQQILEACSILNR